jgi:YVTN family beta-propeller protein
VTQHRQTGITIISVLIIIGGLILLFTGITPNFTLNANELNVNVIPDSLSGLLAFHAQAEAGDTVIGSSEFGTDEKKFGFDKDFVYTSLNNNTQGTPTTTPPSAPPPPCKVTVDTITGLGNAPFGIAYDSVNERIYVTNSDASTVSVIDITTNTVIDTITVGIEPRGIAYSPDNQRMYVTNFGDDTVSVINTTTNIVDSTPITVGIEPFDIAYSRDNQRMYVTSGGDSTVSVINTTTNTVDPTLITVGSAPYGIAYNLVSDRMYVANSLDETVSVINLC